MTEYFTNIMHLLMIIRYQTGSDSYGVARIKAANAARAMRDESLKYEADVLRWKRAHAPISSSPADR